MTDGILQMPRQTTDNSTIYFTWKVDTNSKKWVYENLKRMNENHRLAK